jgi:hypothetical protein
VTWPGSVEWVGGSAPVLQTAPDAMDTIGLLTIDAGTTWYGYHSGSDVAAHIADTSDAHDASAISVLDTGALLTATNVETALAELATDADAHLADTSDAHDASAISIVDAGTYYTSTDVEGALQEIGAGGIGGGSGGGRILIADVHSTPLIFDDLLQEDDASDLLYGDL